MNDPAPQKILIVRTDRIGDVVLSLPMISLLKSVLPQSSIVFLLRTYTRDLVTGQSGLDDILLYDRGGILKPFGAMVAEIRRNRFDAVVVTYPTFRLGLLMFLSRIPLRIGTGYRWYSFFFNKKIFEHRKTAEKHEAEYNVSLLSPLGVRMGARPVPKLITRRDEMYAAEEILRNMGIDRTRPFAVIHPGSGGSARDWPVERFGQLTNRLIDAGIQAVITGGPGEEHLMNAVYSAAGSRGRVLAQPLPLMTLTALIEQAGIFISNSTGPLHIASAVGTPVVSFYPPIRQCSSKRWGPLTEKRVIFEPSSADCPRCKGGPCQSNVCLKQITAEEVADAVISLVQRTSNVRAMSGS